MSPERILEYENVNGVKLSLKIETHSSTHNSKNFTISYKNEKNKGSWPLKSLFFAILFNMLAVCYVRISITAMLIIFIVLSFLIFFWITHTVQSESLLVIPTVGIQSSVKYVCGREDVYVPWASIDDVIINEVIKLNRVLYFLTVLVKSSSKNQSDELKLIPIFKYTKPRLPMLETIYSELQMLLADAVRDEAQLGSGDK